MTIKIAVLGAGSRGRETYGEYLRNNPGEAKIVAAAEPNSHKRNSFAKEHGIKTENLFESWEQLLAKEKLADGIIISTMDKMHLEPAKKAMEKGYKILLEKPIAPNLEDTLEILNHNKKYNVDVLVCHVLRYTSFYKNLKELLAQQVIGKVQFIDHIENIGFYHFAHSFVRGNWRTTKEAAPIILQKTCHDLDLIYWLFEKKAVDLTSKGKLSYFNQENAPQNSAKRCIECAVESECPYSAKKIYLTGETKWPVSVITDDLSAEGVYKAVKEGPYGRCVYQSDNNVADTQTVQMTLEDNIEVNFALTAFSEEINRTTKIFGSHGEIRADFVNQTIDIYKFNKGKESIKVYNNASGHGGGDAGIMKDFISLLKGESDGNSLSTLADSVESHLMAFAAEYSRLNNEKINLEQFRKEI